MGRGGRYINYFNFKEYLFLIKINHTILYIRIILDRYSNDMDDIWSSLDFTIHETKCETTIQTDSTDTATTTIKKDW
jgi:hypothetical protein